MRPLLFAFLVALPLAVVPAACSSAPATGGGGSSGTTTGITGAGGSTAETTGAGGGAAQTTGGTTGAGGGTTSTTGAGGGGGGTGTGGAEGNGGASSGSGGAGGMGGAPPVDSLTDNRDRLLQTYFEYLKASAAVPQSNGLSSSNITSVCDMWAKLDPSAKAVFLTLTARLQGSLLGSDNSSMLFHVTKLYRIAGGQNASANDPGSCGGGEYNRMIMSMDQALHDAQAAANTHKGDVQPNGKRDIADIPASGFWRDSHDLGGAHAPFDESDETDGGAPRGQTQYFADPASAKANQPLGRMDLMSLTDPFALEMDQDYDCVHSSNPLCKYITYGPLCFPEAQKLGTDIYTEGYGSFEPNYNPAGCGG